MDKTTLRCIFVVLSFVTTLRPALSANDNCGKISLSSTSHIIGDDEAGGNCVYPWMVMLHNKYEYYYCGGSIIDASHILTSAQCLRRPANPGNVANLTTRMAYYFDIYTGSSTMPIGGNLRPDYIKGLTKREASAIKVHEKYEGTKHDFDIGIVTLDTPITFDECHKPICLPGNQDSALSAQGCKAMGWGQITKSSDSSAASSELRSVDMNVIELDQCSQKLGQMFNSKNELCVEGNEKGSCVADMGNPLVCRATDGRYFQYGIFSANKRVACATNPGIFTDVTKYISWIKTNTQ